MVTLKDIAETAEVSVWTVSTVLGGKRANEVALKTRNKVEAVAKEMGYVVDDMARAIKTGKTKVIGFVYGASNVDLLEGLAAVCDKNGYFIKLLPFRNDSDKEIQILLERIKRQRMAAVVIFHTTSKMKNLINELNKLDIISIIGTEIKNLPPNANQIVPDAAKGARLAAQHLYSLGHRNIVCIGGDDNDYILRVRENSFCQHLKSCRESVRVTMVKCNDIESLKQQLERLLGGKTNQTAIFAVSGSDTITAFSIVSKLKLNIPEDISIVGYLTRETAVRFSPAIASVFSNICENGEKIAQAIMDIMNGNRKKYFGRELLDIKLFSGESTSSVKSCKNLTK